MSGDSQPIRIRCAADLFEVLSAGSIAAQLAVLRDISQDPARAFALGPHQGEDLVDVLIRLLGLSSGPVKQAQLICLMSFDDPRVTEFLLAEFARSQDAASVLHLGQRIALARGFEFFRPFLWSDGAAQALAAARMCSQHSELTPKERLRVALLLEGQPPPLDDTSLDLWLAELRGVYRLRVRRLVERRGQEALVFWRRYGELAEAERDWLVSLSARLDGEFLKAQLSSLLQQPPVSLRVVEQAFEMGITLPDAIMHSDSAPVRARGIAAGLADSQLEKFLSAEATTREAVSATARCTAPRLLLLLDDPRWEVRAAATEALSQIRGDELPLHELRRKTASPSMGERVAAIEVLRRVDDSEWLSNHLQAL